MTPEQGEQPEQQTKRTRLETEALVIGYAMSRLDAVYLVTRGLSTWRQAFAEAATALSEPPASFKNLRDEFDPVHRNPRRGWRNRPLRPNRQRVLDELEEVSDAALLELVARVLQRDEAATVEAIDSLAVVTRVAHNVAERLLTGRRAEEYFMAHCAQLVQVKPHDLLDLRQAARGFDFGVQGQPQQAIEVKGLKQSRGAIQFTDREWSEATFRRTDYWLVVVGNLINDEPAARVIRDPRATLTDASCRYQKSITATWHATVQVEQGDSC